ncbi:MAG: ATP-binding protein [Prevotella sp.]|nr:ATP-binding protein [Prevotella sp.]
MARLNNPFVVYGYKGPEYFCDRVSESNKLCSALRNERNVTLVSPRRMGKTGLIHHVFNKMESEDKDCKCFYIDIFATKSVEQFVQTLGSAVLGKLDSFSQSALRKIQEFFSAWRPAVTFDQLTGLPTVTLDIRPSEGKESLRQIFEYMKMSGRRCYVAIDEFQQIQNYNESGLEALLRSYIQFMPNVYFIFSGSHQHMMEEMFLSANRPFFQSSMVMSLGSIDVEEYMLFANRMLGEQDRTIGVEAFQRIYDFAGGITWYVQAILHGIYEHPDRIVDNTLVDDVVKELVEEQSATFQNYCAWLTDNQFALLKAIAYEKSVKSPLAQQFIHSHRLPATSSIKTALRTLEDKMLVSHSANEGYSVCDKLFALWLVRF